MAAIKLLGFSGEQPRVIPRLMPPMAAQSAINSRLDDGGLTPMRASTLIQTLVGVSAPVTIFKHGATWLAWDTKVNAVQGPVDQDRLYYTGDGAPKMKVGGTVYPLAVPAPTTALTATLGGSGSGDVQTRLYVYTWVTSFGEESEPNAASAAVNWQPGQSVTLAGFVAAPAGRAITLQRIYRTQTGASGTTLYLIAERAASNANYVDTIPVDGYAEPIPSISFNAPPDTLEGLISLPNGMMAAFSGRDVYFCEPYKPHAWPENYIQTVDFDIVGLGSVGSTLVVLTDGLPYFMTGGLPESMQQGRIEQNLPCINARGIVDLGNVVAYPSNEGLVTVDGSGGFSIATNSIFNRDAWLALSPETMVGAQVSGRYVAFYSTVDETGAMLAGGLVIDVSGQGYLIRIESLASAAFYDIKTGALFYVEAGSLDIRRFDAPTAERLYQYWKSKEFILPAPINFGAIRIDCDVTLSGAETAAQAAQAALVEAANAPLIAAGSVGGELNGSPLNGYPVNGSFLALPPSDEIPTVTVTVFADGEPIATLLRTNAILRLPGEFKAQKWELAIFSNARVAQVVMASTVDELKQVP